jgi:molybdenum cofactor cytidylyltransferase
MIGGIILGAGSSRRFGDDKRRAVLPGGDMVIVRTINNVAAAVDSVLVVLRSTDQAFAELLQSQINLTNVNYYLAPDSAKGMAHSLGNAISQVKGWDGAMVFLADMPFLQQETISQLQQAFTANVLSEPIVVPLFDGTPGHPVTFHSAYFNEIVELTGDKGAKPVINAHLDSVFRVTVDDAGVLKDIDTPEDL